jgi:Avidin family
VVRAAQCDGCGRVLPERQLDAVAFDTPQALTTTDSLTDRSAGMTVAAKSSGSDDTPPLASLHAASACRRAEMAAARVALRVGVWRGSTAMHSSQRTRRASLTRAVGFAVSWHSAHSVTVWSGHYRHSDDAIFTT